MHISSRHSARLGAYWQYMDHPYNEIAREFLRALRGRRSQMAFSRRLGFRTNVAYAWESGRAFPTAAETLIAAERSGVELRDAFERFFRSLPSFLENADLKKPLILAQFLDNLRGRTSIVELAHVTGRSRFALARWLKGQTEPRLPEFFMLIEKTSLRLLDFIAAFVDIERLPSVSHSWHELEATRRAAYDEPYTQLLLRALELEEYRALPRHEPGFLARLLSITEQQEHTCLELLANTGQIHLNHGRWELRKVLAVDTRRDADTELRVKRWWTELGLQRLNQKTPGIFSYNVFAVSDADYARIQDLYRSYFRQVRSIISQSTPSQRVVLACTQLVPLDGKTGKTS
jgi:hypothetical protein